MKKTKIISGNKADGYRIRFIKFNVDLYFLFENFLLDEFFFFSLQAFAGEQGNYSVC